MTAAVNWIDAVAFTFAPYPDTEDIVQDRLKGIVHYAFVNFTKTSFQPEKKVTYNSREYVVRMIKVEANRDFANLAKFLNSFKAS
ncbi:MAG: hypothetical protein JRN15_19745 [Nitrososphaerota archaeon]|nr:hypothetical protein [Nitrososphaerota archaeon]